LEIAQGPQRARMCGFGDKDRRPITPPPCVRLIIKDRQTGTTTRNLIGAVVASAFKLQDTEDNLGIWFVLSDLSVRTEGVFRLKFSFFNLTADQENLLDQGSSAVICTGFSEPFTVYSAKKFPGMIESTELSRRFAAQGVKLAVR
ncbi:velvet factor-domain-containing protein, partial [Protomyces lactucae-debilis]